MQGGGTLRPIVAIRDIDRRLPEAGRIRVGEKGSKGQPVKLDVFRFTSADASAINRIAELYGGQVLPWPEQAGQWQVKTEAKEIPVVLPPDPLGGTPIYELWAGGGVLRRCDGEICLVPMKTPDGAEMQERPCVCSLNEKLECKPKTRLTVILPEVPFGGGWRLESGGWNVAHEMPGMVDMIQSLQERGLLRAMLALEQRTSKFDGQTRKFVVPVLRPSVSIEEIAAGGGTVKALGQATILREAEASVALDGETVDLGAPSFAVDADIVDAEVVEPDVVVVVDGELPEIGTKIERMRKRVHALINELGMGATERHALVLRITNGRHSSSNDLDESGLAVLIAGLEAMRKAEAFYDGVDENGWAVVSRR